MTEVRENALTKKLQGIRIRCLMVDSRNHLWICTSGSGVLELATDGTMHSYTEKEGLLGDKFRTAMELTDGTIALAATSASVLSKTKRSQERSAQRMVLLIQRCSVCWSRRTEVSWQEQTVMVLH